MVKCDVMTIDALPLPSCHFGVQPDDYNDGQLEDSMRLSRHSESSRGDKVTPLLSVVNRNVSDGWTRPERVFRLHFRKNENHLSSFFSTFLQPTFMRVSQ